MVMLSQDTDAWAFCSFVLFSLMTILKEKNKTKQNKKFCLKKLFCNYFKQLQVMGT